MRISRRSPFRLALAASVAIIALTLAGCSATTASAKSEASTSSSWSFTDDLGKTVTLDHKPTKIAGLSEILFSMMNYGLSPVASWGYTSLKDDPRFDAFDISKIAEVGVGYGEISLEKLAEAQPDLIITDVYPTDTKGTIDKTQPDYGFADLEQQAQVEKIAPIVTIYMGGGGDDVIQSITKLAESLGAKSSTVTAAKTKYEAASTALTAAAKANPITVTVFYGDTDGAYAVKVADDPSLRLYKDLGVKFFAPTPDGFYWGIYSWENASKIGGDMLLLSQTGYQVKDLQKQPTFAEIPAMTSGQVHPWVSAGLDYVAQAAYMTQLAGYIAESKVVTN
jgi:iron complex transport system substrate-binding protein